jgi:hypothetical protein
METIDSIYTVLITLVTVLGSAGAWRYYEKKLDKKKNDEFEYRYDCRSRIDKLELLLTQADRDKDEMRKTILELSTQLSALRVKIELLEKSKK